MDAPVWSNDILYLREAIVILIITILIIAITFSISRKEDHRRAGRLAAGDTRTCSSDRAAPAMRAQSVNSRHAEPLAGDGAINTLPGDDVRQFTSAGTAIQQGNGHVNNTNSTRYT
jgi:hypothetical protein